MINVNKPFMPPVAEYKAYIDRIWQNNWLTNNGPLVNELEQKLKEYLEVPHLLYLTNGTIALQFAIKALALKGEIITTPFTYVATCSAIVWEGCNPVFVDIDPESYNIDATKIEAAITPRTSAILATHVYGNACDIDAITAIAKKYKLKVIYDAAHCFGTSYKGKSIFNYGDISTTSFHATKLFHTVEGGAVFTSNAKLLEKMTYMRNFGHDGPVDYPELGINGKNSEMHAAFGLANLLHISDILHSRKKQSQRYHTLLQGHSAQKLRIKEHVGFNYSYYPLLFKNTRALEITIAALNDQQIFPRRYFYPTLNALPYVTPGHTPVAEDIASRILCLPLYHDLTFNEIDKVARIMLQAEQYAFDTPVAIYAY